MSKFDLLIENYVFTNNISPTAGLNTNFKYNTRVIDQDFTGIAVDTTIGFDFNFNARTYRRMLILKNGAIILCGSLTESVSSIVSRLFTGVTRNNKTIRTGTSFIQNDAVLAPWFTEIAYSTYTSPDLNTTQEKDDFHYGKTETFPVYFKGLKAGVWVHKNIPNTQEGQSSIVRWNILVTRNSSPSTLTSYPVEFECQILKNGTIKFAYNRLNTVISNPDKDSLASIAIYTKFGIRDLSSVVLTKNVEEYKFNGYSVSNGSLPENNLTLLNNWPGGYLFNAVLFFQRYPEQRKVLPTIEIHGKKLKDKFNYFDDRLTKVFQNENLNYPIAINRNYGNGTEIAGRLVNNYSKNFTVNTPVKSKSSSNLLNIDDTSYIPPFQDKANLKSEIGHTKLNLIEIDLGLNYSTSMPPISSSVYAYDVTNKAVLMIQPNDIVGPILKNAGRFNWKPDDARAFSATGVHLVSSSIHDTSETYLLPYMNKVDYSGFIEEVSSNQYKKTLELNKEYNKSSNQIVLSVDNNEDFILKMVNIDIPFLFGSDWFDDYTRFEFYSASASSTSTRLLHYDSGGPAITVALYRQSSTSSMELITKGLITHSNDYHDTSVNSIKYVSATSPKKPLLIRERMNFYANPDFIVDANELTSTELSKVVNLKLKPKTYAGVKFLSFQDYENYNQIKQKEFIDLTYNVDVINYTNEIENGSRDKRGFNCSERSLSFETISLKEQYITETGMKIKNPFFYKSLNDTEINYLSTNGDGARYLFISNLISEKENDYILRKNDKLILVVSKTRPTISQTTATLSGTHTVKFFGDIKISLFGEYTKNDEKFILSNNNQNSFNRETNTISSPELFDKNDVKRDKESVIQSRFTPSTINSSNTLNESTLSKIERIKSLFKF